MDFFFHEIVTEYFTISVLKKQFFPQNIRKIWHHMSRVSDCIISGCNDKNQMENHLKNALLYFFTRLCISSHARLLQEQRSAKKIYIPEMDSDRLRIHNRRSVSLIRQFCQIEFFQNGNQSRDSIQSIRPAWHEYSIRFSKIIYWFKLN